LNLLSFLQILLNFLLSNSLFQPQLSLLLLNHPELVSLLVEKAWLLPDQLPLISLEPVPPQLLTPEVSQPLYGGLRIRY
jgi:hypothetical protein